MKLKDMPENTKLSETLLLMPDDVFEQVKETGLITKKVFFESPFSGPTGYWVKTKDTGNRIFPIWLRNSREVLEWKVLS